MLTGESLPVEKAAGDTVIGATLNRTGTLVFEATKVGADTTLAQIVAPGRGGAGLEGADAARWPTASPRSSCRPSSLLAALTFVGWLVFGPDPRPT